MAAAWLPTAAIGEPPPLPAEAGNRGLGADAVLDVGQAVFLDIVRQGLVRLAARLAQLEQHRQQHIFRFFQAFRQGAVGIQLLFRFAQQGFKAGGFGLQGGIGGGLEGGGIVELEQTVDMGQPRILLRFEKKNGIADHLGFCGGQEVDHSGVDIPRPGPAAEVGDALFVDGNDRDLVAGNAAGCLYPQVVGLAFQTLQQIGAGREQKGEGNQKT